MPYQQYRPRTSHAARVLADVDAQRHQHARSYLVVLLPAMMAVAWSLILLGEVAGPPGAITAAHYASLSLLSGSVVVLALLTRRYDAVQLALVSIAVQFVSLLTATAVSQSPLEESMHLLWPLIALAYFGRPHLAAVAGGCTAVILTVMCHVQQWPTDLPIPVSGYVIAFAGLLMAFVSREGRLVELSLVSTMTRDHLALSVSRGIRLAEEPHAALVEIARAIGIATEAQHAVALMFEHEDDYVSDIATWTDPTVTSLRPEPDLTLLDATLRHLLIACHGVLTVGPDIRLLTMPNDLHEQPPAAREDQAVTQAMRDLLDRLNAQSGMLVPLPLGSRAVGAILLTAPGQHDWSTHALPVLDRLTAQLGAGLAQVMLLRDQREALDSLERLNRMRDRLIANVSHELRTPLTSTIGFIETLLRTDVTLTEEQRGKLMIYARDGGMRLLALVEDLLALGSTRPESLDLDPMPIRLRELVDETVRGLAPPDGRELLVTVDDDAAVIADRLRLLQVFSNLVTNAIRHGEGRIEIRISATDQCGIVDVLDEGDGIAEEHREELFLPFSRFSSRSDSTGLGLAICRTIVEAHDGTIEYDRERGHTCFQVRLPLAQA